MEDESVNIDKLKSIFASASGERTIEVTEDEYQKILMEAAKKKIAVEKEDESFTLKFDNLNLKITCDYDEDEDEDE